MYPIKYNDNQTKTLLLILLSPIVCIILRSKLKLTYLSESKYIVIGIWAHYINVFLAFRRTQSRFTSNSIHFFFLLLQWLCYFHMKNFSGKGSTWSGKDFFRASWLLRCFSLPGQMVYLHCDPFQTQVQQISCQLDLRLCKTWFSLVWHERCMCQNKDNSISSKNKLIILPSQFFEISLFFNIHYFLFSVSLCVFVCHCCCLATRLCPTLQPHGL